MVKTSPAPRIEAYKVKHPITWEAAKIAFSVVILAAGIALAIVLARLAEAPPTKESTALIQQVRTHPAQAYSGSLFLEVSGNVVPHREVKVAAEVAGRIKKRYPACENGMFVTQGEPLLEIDPETYELELKTLEADVTQAQRRIEENRQQMAGERKSIELSRADLALQQKELDRNRRISNALSQTEMEQSTRAYNTARQQLTTRENSLATMQATAQTLEAALEFSKQQIEKAKLNLRRTTIYAPADGVIVRALVQEGDFVSAGTMALMFEDTSRAEVLVNLTPSELKWIRDNSRSADPVDDNLIHSVYRIPPTEVAIFDPANPAVSWAGLLTRFDGIGRDDVTKTIPCRITVEQPIVDTPLGKQVLVRGMYVKCKMVVHLSSNETTLFSVPEVALHPDHSLWIVAQDRTLRQIKVSVVNRTEHEINRQLETFVVVKADSGGFSAGDQVIVTPLSQPFTGMPVLLEGAETDLPAAPESNQPAAPSVPQATTREPPMQTTESRSTLSSDPLSLESP